MKRIFSVLLALILTVAPAQALQLDAVRIDREVFLSWTPDDPNEIEYELYVVIAPRGRDRRTPLFSVSIQLPADTTEWVFTCPLRAYYTFRVRPIYSTGYGTWANVVDVHINN